MDRTAKLIRGSPAKRISPTTLFLLFMLVTAAGYVALGMAWVKQEREQKDLVLQIEQLRPTAAVANEKLGALERRVAAVREQLAAEQASFPSRLSNTEIVDWVQQVAAQSQVKAFVLQAKPISIQKIGASTYNVLRFEITAQGDFTRLETFIQQLEDSPFQTLVLDRVDLNLDQGKSSATVGFSIYAHPVVAGIGGPESK